MTTISTKTYTLFVNYSYILDFQKNFTLAVISRRLPISISGFAHGFLLVDIASRGNTGHSVSPCGRYFPSRISIILVSMHQTLSVSRGCSIES